MVLEFKFPDVGEGITEGHIVKWRVKEGDEVRQDQVIVEIETDKAVVEIPAPQAGVILKINAKEGETVQVGQVIVVIGDKGEKLPVGTRIKEAIKTAIPPPRKDYGGVVGELEEAPEEKPQPKPEPKIESSQAGVKALPKTRKIARDLGIDISRVPGTGPSGLITEQDVKSFLGHPALPEPATEEATAQAPKVTFDKYGRVLEIPMSGIRKKIAENMVKSVSTAPQAVEMEEADVTELVKLREREKKRAEDLGVHLTYLPFIIKAVIAALQKHPYVNSTYDQQTGVIVNKQYYNIGVAVDTPYGLMVPVIKNADKKSMLSMAHDMEVLSEQARSRKISLEDLKGGTFTITNYGSLGGIFGVPIINYPEAAILGVGRIIERPVVKEGRIVIRKIMPLSLAFDHRVIDGAQAARFITTLMSHLEDPDFLLIDIG